MINTFFMYVIDSDRFLILRLYFDCNKPHFIGWGILYSIVITFFKYT